MSCCISNNEFCEDIDIEIPNVNLEMPINRVEENEENDWELPPDLLRMVEQEEREIEPHQEETEVVNLGTSEEKKEVKIGTCVSIDIWEELVALLQDYQDIFAWSYQDMSGLSSEIMQQRLPLNPDCSPVKQKLSRMKHEMSLKIKEEVKKQFDVGLLVVARYPEWVANIVPIPKKDGKVRMCMDYQDLDVPLFSPIS